MRNLKTLVMMQLKDKLDFSFMRSKRSLILMIVLEIVKLVAVTAVFFLVFYLCVAFQIFSFSRVLPDTVINIIFTLIQIMAIVTCTVGLSNALYLSNDNKVLLTLPVTNNQIFVSKLILFYVFEIKRNLSLTLPMFIAYGIINNAVWYYYFWLLLCFAIISLIPVVIGALLSIPALYVGAFVRNRKWLQYVLMIVLSAGIVAVVVYLINLIPENINILGQWGSISVKIQQFLNAFKNALLPFYWLCLLAIGGTLRISSRLFWIDTLAYFGGALGVIAVFFVLAFLLARPLFFKMASKQFEYEKRTVAPRQNKVFPRFLSSFLESLQMEFRSSRHILLVATELALPALTLLFLNKIYASMNTSFSGLKMTQTFNLLVLFVVMLAFNTPYASVYSKEASARNILKTRPTNPLLTLFSRISSRAIVITLSCVAAITTYAVVNGNDAKQMTILFFVIWFLSIAHLLWCAEIDVMKSQADQYQTIGLDFDSPNERTATITGLLMSALVTGVFYLISDQGITSAFVKLLFVAALFLAVRVYLYVTRVKLYFVEK